MWLVCHVHHAAAWLGHTILSSVGLQVHPQTSIEDLDELSSLLWVGHYFYRTVSDRKCVQAPG